MSCIKRKYQANSSDIWSKNRTIFGPAINFIAKYTFNEDAYNSRKRRSKYLRCKFDYKLFLLKFAFTNHEQVAREVQVRSYFLPKIGKCAMI